MKVRPEIILNDNNNFLYNNILITGSDESLISYVKEHFIKKFRNNNYFIDTSGNYNMNISGDLFSDKKVLFLLKEYPSKKIDFENIKSLNQSVLISTPNSKKINVIKNEFNKSKDALVIECYSLNRKSKELVLKQHIDRGEIDVSVDIYWYIIENFANQFVLFIQQLHILSLLKMKINSIDVVEKAVLVENKIELSKIIFHIFNNKKPLINIFTKNIYSQADFYIFLNSLKLYFEMVGYSESKEAALSKFPRYLFNEKDVFIKIYNQLNKKKLIEIFKNISKAEILVRKNPSLHNIIGLRLLLNTKKIISS